eukprot:2839167-Rhodomonas_salina.1
MVDLRQQTLRPGSPSHARQCRSEPVEPEKFASLSSMHTKGTASTGSRNSYPPPGYEFLRPGFQVCGPGYTVTCTQLTTTTTSHILAKR